MSVIVPAFNVATYIERALASALGQSMPNLEVIVVDDGSTDTTLELTRGVARADPRVRVLYNQRNEGLSASRNRAIGVARGEWIALLDADDIWLPERLERMLAATDDADVVSDDIRIIRYDNAKPIGQNDTLLVESPLCSLLWQKNLSTGPMRFTLLDLVRYDLGLLQPLIRRSFLNEHRLKHDCSLRHAADFHLYFEILAAGARWHQLPEGYYLYFKHSAAMSKDKLTLWKEVIKSSEALLQHSATANDERVAAALRARIREAQGHVSFAVVRGNLRQLNFMQLAYLMWESPGRLAEAADFIVRRLYLRLMWRARHLGVQLQQMVDSLWSRLKI